ncbi:hypothetical protein PL11201_330015 [Planktothrix sp. PCC 11201]|nr:hypothetical protein PL11201_330015 [Planktothrix sp. PCC 11201]
MGSSWLTPYIRISNQFNVNQPQILHPLFQNSKPSEFETDTFTPLPPKPNHQVRAILPDI